MYVKTRNSSKDTEKIALICKYVNMPGRGGGTIKIGGAQKNGNYTRNRQKMVKYTRNIQKMVKYTRNRQKMVKYTRNRHKMVKYTRNSQRNIKKATNYNIRQCFIHSIYYFALS